MNTVIGLWPTPLYHSHITLSEGLREQIRGQEFVPFSRNIGSCTRDTHLLDQPIMADLRREIMRHVEFYTRDHLAVADHIEFYITNSWCTQHLRGDFGERHTHSNSLISGVLYVDCEPLTGDIRFFKDFNLQTLWPGAVDLDCSNFNEINSKYWAVTPRVGDILLFPSSLAHGAQANQTDSARHCVAFNLFARGQLGAQSDPPITGLVLRS
jgi:uncharacterized protein (TIGR02466 family)